MAGPLAQIGRNKLHFNRQMEKMRLNLRLGHLFLARRVCPVAGTFDVAYVTAAAAVGSTLCDVLTCSR